MNTLHISTGDSIYGAMIAAHRLSVAMNKNGLTSRMLVAKKNSNDPLVFENGRTPIRDIVHKIELLADFFFSTYILKATYTFTTGVFGQKCSHDELIKADIIYIHWTESSFLNSRSINQILQYKKPTFFFLHDMYHITGGCHHSLNCTAFKEACSHCPMIGRKCLNGHSAWALREKRKALLNRINVQCIAPSHWMGECARESILFKDKNIFVIPNLIDTSIFRIIERSEARRRINLPISKKIILFGAINWAASPYKGGAYMMEAFGKIQTENVEIVIFGGNISDEDKAKLIQKVHQFGILSDQQSLMLLYNSCDVFVIPSIAENYPQTVMESISCGTPVVGFDVGGIPDLVQTGKTGYLAKYKDANDLATGIDLILQGVGDFGEITRESLHSFAEENFSENIVVEKHKALWKQLGITSYE